MRPLLDIRPGETARLTSVGGQRSFQRRLMELGLLPGTLVRLVRRVGVGDLVELEVRGGHISLRDSEARELRFERCASCATDEACARSRSSSTERFDASSATPVHVGQCATHSAKSVTRSKA